MTVSLDNTSEQQARRWFRERLEHFTADKHPSELATPVGVLHLGFDAETHWGPGYGRLQAPENVLRPLGELVSHALNDLSRHR